MKTLIPTQLFIGSQETLEEKTEELLQNIFCSSSSPSKGCYCNNCRKIKNRQHELIVFINPEKDYTVKEIEVIFEKTNFALDENQNFFFILQKTQTLNLACANKLLKVLEEPPRGYNFILHTNNLNSILPTIRSRCHIVNFKNEDDSKNTTHPLLLFFYDQKLNDPIEFEKELRQLLLTDSQSLELAQEMLLFYSKKIINFYKNPTPYEKQEIKYVEKIHEYLKEILQKPPQSGSSILFWKNLYINFPKT